MAEVLIGYATRGGTARDIAHAVGKVLQQDHEVEVRVADLAASPSPGGAGIVILGSGIHTGSWYPEALEWISRHEEQLRSTQVIVFNCCLNAADPAKRDESLAYNDAVVALTGAVRSETFAGRYEAGRRTWVSRLLLRLLRQPEQDHLDLGVVAAWARGLR